MASMHCPSLNNARCTRSATQHAGSTGQQGSGGNMNGIQCVVSGKGPLQQQSTVLRGWFRSVLFNRLLGAAAYPRLMRWCKTIVRLT